MGLKVKEFTINDEFLDGGGTIPNRDVGLVFEITEMSAMEAEKWASRAFAAIRRAGNKVPDEVAGSGMAGIAMWGLEALSMAPWEEADQLRDELLKCAKIVTPAIKRTPIWSGPTPEIFEAATVTRVRREVFELHTNFIAAAARSILTSAIAAGATLNTSTSLPLSDASSAPTHSSPASVN